MSSFWQVCSLPPAWGYAHCGLERFLQSFPWVSWTGDRASSRLIKQEDDQVLLNWAKQREDRMAFVFAFCKLLRGLRVGSTPFFHRQEPLGSGVSANMLMLWHADKLHVACKSVNTKAALEQQDVDHYIRCQRVLHTLVKMVSTCAEGGLGKVGISGSPAALAGLQRPLPVWLCGDPERGPGLASELVCSRRVEDVTHSFGAGPCE